MLIALLFTTSMLVICSLVQVFGSVWAVTLANRFYQRSRKRPQAKTLTVAITTTMLMLTAIVQVALWAALLNQSGQLPDFTTAFYFSSVNFSTLGYGDIMLTDTWRLAGPQEALNGMLMFGVSGATAYAVFNRIFFEQENQR